MLVILGFAAMAIDVGYWFSQKREVQKAVDAAALAGAQELPDDYVMAETVAREYLTKNGITAGDTISITFRCTSTYQIACDPGANKWDSIVVEVERPAEAWFARVFGIQEALVRDVRAVGCHGSCGGSPFQPVDVVQIIDRSGSMSDSDMVNAKDGARALLEYFQGDIQRVGLAVLAPGSSANPCVSPASQLDPSTWLPVNLSDDYQSGPGVLNEGSQLVSTIDCLEQSGIGTNIGNPLEAAKGELVANGRPDVKWGIVLLTDGAANQVPGERRSPAANARVTSDSGDNNGFETNPANAYGDDALYASDVNSGTSTSTSCGATSKDRHDFYDFGFSIPGGNTIVGIEVRLDARADSSYSSPHMCVQLSWDNGAHWTSAKDTSNLSSSFQEKVIYDQQDPQWGHTWTPGQLSNGNLRVRITNVSSSTSRDFYLDWVSIGVYHSQYSGPCAYAAAMGDAAKAAGIEVFTIGYGVDEYDPGGGNECGLDAGSWNGKDAVELLSYIATDAQHFFNEPSTADLRPIFEVIGSQLASGSRLVE